VPLVFPPVMSKWKVELTGRTVSENSTTRVCGPTADVDVSDRGELIRDWRRSPKMVRESRGHIEVETQPLRQSDCAKRRVEITCQPDN